MAGERPGLDGLERVPSTPPFNMTTGPVQYVIGNVGDYAGRSFRVGLMSPPQIEPHNILGTLGAIEAALEDSREQHRRR